MEPSIDLYSIISIIAQGQTLILACYFMFRKGVNVLPYRWLALLFLIIGFNLFHHLSVQTGFISQVPHLFGTGGLTTFLIGPVVYLFVMSFVDVGFRLKPLHSLHFLPFIAHQAYKTPDYLMGLTEKHNMINRYYEIRALGFPNFDWTHFWQSFFTTGLHPLLYASLAILALTRYRASIKEKRRVSNEYAGIKWMTLILAGYLVTWFVAEMLFPMVASQFQHRLIWNVRISLISLHVLLITFLALSNPLNINNNSIITATIPQPRLKELKDKLEMAMVEKKLFLKPDLKLADLAGELSISSRVLSRIISEELKVSFYDYMNEFRVEEAKRLLLDENNNLYTIDTIGQESGFNSKDVFYRHFKQRTGLTPAKFKKTYQANQA